MSLKHLSYIDKLNLTSKEYNNTINLTENGSYFDIELDLYTGNQEVTRDIKEGVTYKGEIRIKNLGESVTNFETYFDWDYDEELIKLTSNEKECKINTDQGKYLRCEFKTFMENETKTVDIKVLALKEGSQFAETITRYDPPINLNKIFNAIKNFFAKIFDSIGGGLTGQVVREIPESNDKEIIDVNLEETTKQEVDEQPKPKIEIGTETDKEEINLPPRVNLKQLPNFVTGNIVLDASETTDYEGDLLNYKFLLSKDETFENPNILCFGESPTCNWNTEVSDCVYCYIQLVVLDGKDESYSKIMRTFRLEQEEKPQDIKENATEEAQETTTKKKKKGSGTTQTIIEKKYDIFSDPTKTWITTKEKLFFKTTTAKENQTVKVFGKNNTLQNYTATIISETFEGKKSVILEFTNSKKIARIEIRNLEPDTEIEIGIEEELENVSFSIGCSAKIATVLTDPTEPIQ